MKRCAPILLIMALTACRRPEAAPEATERPDIVLVTLDTVRADALHFAGNAHVETPNLDAVARAGRVFVNAHAHNVVTLPSHVNILTGIYPFRHGVRDNGGAPLPESVPTAASLLSAAGYATAAFVGAFPLDARFGLARGFDVYDDRYGKGTQTHDFALAERPASEVVKSALAWWSLSTPKPRFIWIHLYDAHAPYTPPAPFDARYSDDPYLGEIAAVDAALGPFLNAVTTKTNVLLVVTADHGEARGDHGELTHGLFAYECTLKVPLVLWGASAGHGSDPRLARHVDILPTLLQAARVAPPKDLDGTSLLGPTPPDVTSYFESLSATLNRGWAPLRGAISGTRKAIDLPNPELYDLAADPAETRNLASDDAALRALLRRLPSDAYTKASARSVSAADAAKLRGLGYLAGGSGERDRYAKDDDPKKLIALDSKLHATIDAYQNGRLDEAIRLAKEAIAERPTMAVAYEQAAFLYESKGDSKAAESLLREARRRGLGGEALETRLALLLCETGRAREAIALLLPRTESRDTDTLNALGIAHSDAGEGDEAVSVFRKVLALDPRNASAWQNLGIAELRRGRLDSSRAALAHALELNDRLARALNALGIVEAKSGNVDAALASWRRAVDNDPSQIDALMNIGSLAAEHGKKEEAVAAYREFLSRAPATLRRDRREAEAALRSLR